MLTHTYTHTHTYPHSHRHTLTQSYTLTQILRHQHTHIHTCFTHIFSQHSYTLCLIHTTHTLSHTHSHTLSHTLTHSHTHTYTHNHTHILITYSHTHILTTHTLTNTLTHILSHTYTLIHTHSLTCIKRYCVWITFLVQSCWHTELNQHCWSQKSPNLNKQRVVALGCPLDGRRRACLQGALRRERWPPRLMVHSWLSQGPRLWQKEKVSPALHPSLLLDSRYLSCDQLPHSPKWCPRHDSGLYLRPEARINPPS